MLNQEIVRPVSSDASSEANQQEKIQAAIINLSVIPIIQPSSVSTFDVGPLPEYPDEKDITKFPLVIRDELMNDNDMNRPIIDLHRLNPGVREKVWRDSYLKNRQSIHLHRLNGINLVELCKDVLSGLTHEMTERRAANTMLLAWNMRQFDMVSHVFSAQNPCAAASDIGIDTLNKRVLGKSGMEPYVRPEGIENDEYVAACAYISASTLRLFSQSADNYMTAVDKHIPRMFYTFYNMGFPLTEFKPDKKCIEALKLIYTTKPVYRNTLAPFLYEFKGLKDAKGMCQMLYEQDLAFTGIYGVNLYLRACFGLHASLVQLGSCLWHRFTKETLISLCRICRKYALDPSLENSRDTWKYARLYGTGYFPLHPDKSKVAVCCLAIICKKLGISENQDLMHIEQLRNLFFWESSNVWADRTVAWFRANASPHLDRSPKISSVIRDDAPSKKGFRDEDTQHTHPQMSKMKRSRRL
jgi:hypothetical protein